MLSKCRASSPTAGRGEHADKAAGMPNVLVERGSAHLAAEHCVLMTQHDDLKVLPVSGTYREASELGEESVQKTRHEGQGWRYRP